MSEIHSVPSSAAALGGAFRFTVNAREGALSDPVPAGRQLLVACGFVPADEHVLIQLLAGRTQSIGLDEEVDLRAPGLERFRAFRSDRLYLFTVDGNGFEWGDGSISEADLRQVADVPADRVLILERAGSADVVLKMGEAVSLTAAGTERLRTASRLVLVLLDDEFERLIPRGSHTTEELLTLLKVTPGYLLNLQNAAGQLQPLEPKQSVFVEDGMRFYSQAPGGGAS